MTRWFVVRHGNTFAPGELPRRIGARTDLPLVASGIAQAEALGAWFALHGVRFTRALAGPLRRTCETAALILSHAGDVPSIELADWLTEIDHGSDENQSEAQVVARIGAFALQQWDERGAPPPGWCIDAQARLDAWRTLCATRTDGDVLLVTSNGSARFALLAAGLRPAGSMKLRTGAFGCLAMKGTTIELCAWDVRPSD